MVRFTLATALALTAATTPATLAFTVLPPQKSAFVGTQVATPGFTSSSSTALNMNLFDRFSRVAKSNLNNVLKNLEDPEKIMTQALEDMQVGY